MRAFSMLLAGGLFLAAPVFGQDSLQRQIDDLKAQIQELRQTTEPAEPVEEIKQVTEWVSPSGELFTESQPGNVSPTDGSPLTPRITYRKMKFFRRAALADQISGGIQTAMASHLSVGMSMVGIFQNLVGNGENNKALGTGGNRSAAQGSVDLTFLGTPMLNTTIFVDLEGAVGSGVDTLAPNQVALNAHTINTQAIPEGGGVPLTTFFLREAWFQVQTGSKALSLQAGQIDLAKSFDQNSLANDETSQFLSGDLVNDPVLENPSNPAQPKPFNALGAVVAWDTFHDLVAKFGAESSTTNPVNPTDALYLIAELDGSYNFLSRDGVLRVWARQKPRGDGQPPQALGLSWNQRLGTQEAVFLRYGKSNYVEDGVTHLADNLYDYAVSGGLEFDNFIPSRLKDRAGLAVGRTQFQDGSREENGEAYFRTVLTPSVSLALIYQAVFSRLQAGGADPLQPIHVLGLRTQMSY
jgi:hypothetical protein